jgi:hypothetical protein
MMNDRFAADLRRHLLGTASERPAEGQLAAVIAGVAVTRQRHPIVARLTWAPRRLSLFPSPAVRYGLILAGLVLTTLGAAILTGSGRHTRSTVFEGTWESIDPHDGSRQILVVGPSTKPTVHFQDDVATGAACAEDPVKVFTADGTGVITDNHLETSFPNGGGCGVALVPLEIVLDFIPASGTATDQDGVDWTLAAGGDGPPASAAASSPASAVASPTVGPSVLVRDPDCQDFSRGGGDYTAELGSLLVSMPVPAAPLTPWEGRNDGFYLAGSCATGRPIDIRATIVTTVYVNACDPGGRAAKVATQADAVRAFAAQRGHDTDGPTEPGEIDGRATAGFVISASECDNFVLWNGVAADDHGVGLVYLIDVDGEPLGILLRFRDEPFTESQRAEALLMVSSIEIRQRSGLSR